MLGLRQFAHGCRRALRGDDLVRVCLARRLATAPSPPRASPPRTVASVLRQPLDEGKDTHVTVVGWVRSCRAQKSVSFLELTDGSCATGLQVVWDTPAAASIIVPPSAHVAGGNNGGAAAAAGKEGPGDKSQTPSASTPEPGAAPRVTTGCSVVVHGRLVKSPKPAQPVEVHATRIEVAGCCDQAGYPLQKKSHTPEFMRDMVHLRARAATSATVLRMRHTLALGIHQYFAGRGYFQVHTPVLTSNDCEGAGELFTVRAASSALAAAESPVPAGKSIASVAGGGPGVAPAAAPPGAHGAATAAHAPGEFFGKPVYLTVSGQLHLEAFACALSRVYTFGPTFRAENSNTPRHLAEFWMLEPEVAPGGMEDAMELAEGCVRHTLTAALAARADDIRYCADKIEPKLMERYAALGASSSGGSGAQYARLTYTQAVAILQKCGRRFKFPVEWGLSLHSEHERYLAEIYVQGPVFVTDYPAAIKPFYMRRNDADGGKTVAAFDLLVPGIGELVGGSAREERPHILAPVMRQLGLLSPAWSAALDGGADVTTLPPADTDSGGLDWYLDLRKYGTLPHAGWGLGFERLVMLATGIENIRDVVPVPRVPGSCRM